MTCAKAADNIIKQWKNTHNLPLTDWEEKQLARAVKWFGPSSTNRWPLITRCFLPNRAPYFLKMEYQNIVSDHQRAERFGRLMMTDTSRSSRPRSSKEEQKNGEESDEGFEDIDLDKISEE